MSEPTIPDAAADTAAHAPEAAPHVETPHAETPPPAAEAPAIEAASKESFIAKLTKPEGLFGKVKQDGFTNTVKDHFNPKSYAEKGGMKVFGRVAGTGVGVYMAGDALLRSKKGEGEDRSGLVRVGEFILGGGVAAASALGGRVHV